MTADHGAWVATLNAYEARVDAAREAVVSGDLAQPPPFQPPVDLGPMPPELVERASALLARSRDLQELIVKARGAIAAKLAQPTTPTPAPRRASRLDVSV